jgi:hypothetical protein
LVVFAAFGLAYGLVLQRSRFCFARAAYELFLLRSRDALDGVMAALLITTLGFGAVTLGLFHRGLRAESHLLILPVGPGVALGAFAFGLGMALVGMCASGTLQRMGEGYAIAWLSLAGIIAGAALDPGRGGATAWLSHPGYSLSLGQWTSPAVGFLLTLSALALIWVALTRRRNSRRAESLAAPVIGGALLGLLNTAQLALASPWTVGYPLALVPSLWSRHASGTDVRGALPLLVLDTCMVAGALVAAAAQGGLRLRWPRRFGEAFRALAGGVLMGFGIKLAHGCNVGGILSALPSLSLSAWLYLPSMLLGAWFGVKLISKWS